MPGMDGAALGHSILRDPLLARTRLVMLTSLDREGDMKHFAGAGFAAYLAKPLRRRELLQCLRTVLGHDTDAWQASSQPMITRSSLLSGGDDVYRGTVLVVEDNVINQRVASRFLERSGCKVEIAANGAAAVDAFEKDHYSMIFMDMQMPVMDGLEATRRIRAIEASEQRLRTPIVALTANAHAGQMEICLDAGMDDYLTKPLDIERMRSVLDRYVDRTDERSAYERTVLPSPAAPDTAPMTSSDSQMFERLRDIAGEDDEFVAELIAEFLVSGKSTIEEMRAAMAIEDLDALGCAAHKLKGASKNLHIETLGQRLQHIELAAKAKSQQNFQTELRDVLVEFERVSAVLSNRPLTSQVFVEARQAQART
jgi:two-component system sensor histidine kinase/response regulator